MPLTRSFRRTVADRAKASPGFRAALIEEAMQALAEGDTDTARTLLRDVTNATLGFQALAAETGIPEKSLMRMLGASGNPSLSNVGRIVRALTKHAGVSIRTTVEPAPAAA